MIPLDPCEFWLDSTVKQHLANKDANCTCEVTLVQIRHVSTYSNWTCFSCLYLEILVGCILSTEYSHSKDPNKHGNQWCTLKEGNERERPDIALLQPNQVHEHLTITETVTEPIIVDSDSVRAIYRCRESSHSCLKLPELPRNHVSRGVVHGQLDGWHHRVIWWVTPSSSKAWPKTDKIVPKILGQCW